MCPAACVAKVTSRRFRCISQREGSNAHSMPMVSRHTSYILLQLVLTTITIAAVLVSVIWLTQSLRFLDFIINRGLSVLAFLEITLLLMPSILPVTLPVAVLCAVIFTFNRLTVDRELVVMRSAGLGPWDMARPVIVLGVLAAIVGWILTLWLSPAGFRDFKDEQAHLRSDFHHLLLRKGTFNQLIPGFTVYYRDEDREGRFHGIIIHDNRERERKITMLAQWGSLVAEDGGLQLVLANGTRQEIAGNERSLRMLYFDSYALDLAQLSGVPPTRNREPKERYLHELISGPFTAIDGSNSGEFLAEAHRRLALPLASLVMALIGFSALTAGEFDRRHQWPRIVSGLGLGLLYLGVSFSLTSLVVKNTLLIGPLYGLPVIALWLAIWTMMQHRFSLPFSTFGALRTGV